MFRTPLHISIENSNTSIFALLLRHQNTPALEIKNADGLPPMWYALQNLQEATEAKENGISPTIAPNFFASQLISAGASPNAVRLSKHRKAELCLPW